MNWLARLPCQRRSTAGLEWVLWKRLPAVLAWGTVLPLGVAGSLCWSASGAAAGAVDGATMLHVYRLLALVLLHWTLVLTVGIGCVIVMLMKGPAYVADAYPLPGDDHRD